MKKSQFLLSLKKHMGCLPLCCMLILIFLLLCKPDIGRTAAATALHSLGNTLLPVLYPYMVLSQWIGASCTASGRTVFFTNWILGAACGYPIGARLAAENRQNGSYSTRQAAWMAAFSSHAGPAFVIHMAGGACWQDKMLGVLLYSTSIAAGLGGMLFYLRRFHSSGTAPHEQTELPASSLIRRLGQAITQSAGAAMALSGTVVFFSVIAAYLPGNGVCRALMCSILEFTCGVRESAAMGGYAGLFCTGFAIGFGGISVLAQIALVSEKAYSLQPYILWKAFCGLLCGSMSMLYGRFSGNPPASVLPFAALYKGSTFFSPGDWLLAAAILFYFTAIPLQKYLRKKMCA